MSAFGNKIREILKRIDKNEQWLSERSGISKATISEWSSNADRVPSPASVKAVVLVFTPFKVDPDEIYEAAGYHLVKSKSGSHRMERLERLAAAHPNVLDRMEMISNLPPPEQEEVVRLIDAWHATQRRK